MAVDMMRYRYFNEMLFFEEAEEAVKSNIANTEIEMLLPLAQLACLQC